jgi:hypothetical protein
MALWRPIGAYQLNHIAPRSKPRPRQEEAWHSELPDVGCQYVSDSCLSCPLPSCIHDLPTGEAYKLRVRLKQEKLKRDGQ